MGIKSTLVRALNAAPYRQYVKDCQNPQAAFRRVWRESWNEIKAAPFWRQHRTADRLELFPVTDYDSYKPALDRSFAGDVSELSGARILYWGDTSGTSGFPKVFPITAAYLRQISRITQPFQYMISAKFPDFLKQPILFFAAARSQRRSPAGLDVGSISRYMYLKLPRPIQKNYALPGLLFDDADLFNEWSPLYALATDLSGFFVITPARLIQMYEYILRNRELHFDHLTGRKRPPAVLPPLKVPSSRLRLLEKAFSNSTPSFKDVWPGLQIITTWKSSTCGLQLPLLEKYNQGRVLVTDGQYCATEGWMTVTQMDDRVGTVFHPGTHAVEFFPADETPDPKNILKPWELQAGREYEVLLTTAMGFIRYRLYDVVRCNGFWHQSPILEFMSKSGNVISLGSTRFSELHVLEALTRAGLVPKGRWVLGPSRAGDQLLLYTDSDQGDVRERLRVFNAVLCELNFRIKSDYDLGLLKPVEVRLVPSGAFSDDPVHAQSKQKIISQKPLGTEG